MRRGPWIVSTLLALVALGPALAPGYVLSYDMVAVPRLDFTRDLVGLGDGLPRAVPVDAVAAALSLVVPGAVLQKLTLLATLVLAGAGAGRLVAALLPNDRGVAATVAAAAYVWNPFVAERLVLGHWALLVAYATLPWLVVAAGRARDGDRRQLAVVALLLGACALTPTGGLLGGLAAGAVLAGRWRVWVVVAAAWVAVNAPWWVPGVLHESADRGGAETGVAAFALRGEGLLGPLGSVVSLGGAWNSAAVPPSRETALGVLATLLLLACAAVGTRPLLRSPSRNLVMAMAVAAGVGIALALLGATPVARAALADLVREVPAAGLLRDGQKWLAPWALLLSVAVGAGVARLVALVKDRAARMLVPAAAVLVLVALLPDLAWGVAGRLEAVQYPSEWERVRHRVDEAGGGDVLVLPWGAFRAFGWNGGRTVLDPATRYLPGSVVADDDLVVGDRRVPGEGIRSGAARAALDGPDPGAALRRLGVRWVLVHRGQPGPWPLVPAGRTVHEGATLTLVRLSGPVTHRPLPGTAGAVLAADVLAIAVLVAAATAAARRGEAPRRGLLVGTVPRGTGAPAGRDV
jgi:hypothetical protein